MALADPQTVGSSTLNLTKPEPTRSTYQSADGTERLIVSYTEDKSKTRYLVRKETDSLETDPISGATVNKTRVVYLVMDQPSYGVTDAEMYTELSNLVTWLTASSGANALKVLSNQH